MSFAPFGRRTSNQSSQTSERVDPEYGETWIAGVKDGSSSSSSLLDDNSDKESLQSWAKEQQEKEAEQDDELFAAKEKKHLRRWFILITFALIVVGVCVSVFTFYYLDGEEEENFETSFQNTAQAIIDSSAFRMKVLERALLSRSQQLTSFAVFTTSLWPFVSLPDFYAQGRNFLLETETQMVAWAPLVTSDRNLRAWESYSTFMLENSGWFPPVEAQERLKKQMERLEEQAKGRTAHSGEKLSSEESGLYVPLWQLSPWLYNGWINHNLTAQFEESILLLLSSKRPVWTRFLDIANPPESHNNQSSSTAYYTTTGAPAQEEEESSTVASFLFQPVFRSLRNHDVSYEDITNITEDSDEVVGIYMAAVQWDKFLLGLVPEGTPGVHLVLKNPWGQTLTYEVNKGVEGVASISLLVGTGDQHASEYDGMSQTTNLTTRTVGVLPPIDTAVTSQVTTAVSSGISSNVSSSSAATPGQELSKGYTSPEYTDNLALRRAAPALDKGDNNIATRQAAPPAHDYAGSGHFQMTIYPTFHFESTYTSNEPLTYTLILAAVVFFAIAVFFLYSRFVHNRQQKLVETANRTALVVKSLFPSNVRDRIMQEAEESEMKSKAKRRKKQQQQLDGSNSEPVGLQQFHASASSILGGISVASSRSGISLGGAKKRPSGDSRGARRRRPSVEFRAPGRFFDRRLTGSSDERSEGDRSHDGMGSSSQHNNPYNPYGSKPIADHFKETTVLFGDMVGFTAWSSVREPTSVFTLLETIYHAFDKVAKKRGIFKVIAMVGFFVSWLLYSPRLKISHVTMPIFYHPVAVCGLPVARPDHAIAMSYFANDCLRKMKILVKKLEVSLGPDTADLSMRIGLHSGPVTAGVLRGEKSRFQLFGDTVNTAARMESNGMKDCIHVSQETANLLIDAGKQRWLKAREEKIHAKGKGELQTYWLIVRSMDSFRRDIGEFSRRPSGASGVTDDMDIDIDDNSTIDDSNSDGVPPMADWESGDLEKDEAPDEPIKAILGDRVQRLVDWNVDQLVSLLKKIAASRKGKAKGEELNLKGEVDEDRFKEKPELFIYGHYLGPSSSACDEDRFKPIGTDFDLRTDSSILEEVTEVISFPKPTIADTLVGDTTGNQTGDVELDSKAVSQLHRFMTTVASLYNDNPFHNFAHASHVTMALITWLSRITPLASDAADENIYEAQLSGDWKRRSDPSKDMYALQSDPLLHFALVFAALIHDLEHAGVTNAQLIKEKAQIATLYNEKSIHEQASVDSAFEILMEDTYSQLRNALFSTQEEFYRFRQIVINTTMATDILDKKVMAKQDVRWGCLFRDHEEEGSSSSDEDIEAADESDEKTSIVVERLLVISDIAHTMQHWYVYRKWNEKLFEENYMAFKAGRADEDPSLTWYGDELVFFDTYVIPLATKMKNCELFDSSCDEYVRYAKSNREQWENTGREEVASMVERFKELEFEVKDNYNPIADGRIYSPTNAKLSPTSAKLHDVRDSKESENVARPPTDRPKAKNWSKALEKFTT